MFAHFLITRCSAPALALLCAGLLTLSARADDPVPPAAPAAQLPAAQPPLAPTTAPATTPPAATPTNPPTAAAPKAVKPKSDAPEALLLMKDGSQYQGFLVLRDERQYVLRIAGIDTRFEGDAVDRCEVLPPIADRYRELRAAIADDDIEQLSRMMDWLLAREQTEFARSEAAQLAMRMPDDVLARRAAERILRQVILQESVAKAAAPGAAANRAAAPAPAPSTGPQPFEPFPLLTQDQINLLKVFEIDLAKPPRLDIPREVITKVIEQYAGHPLVPSSKEGRDALYRKSAPEQLDILFRLKAREFYPRIKVLDPPEALRIFRDDVQRSWLANTCATYACHGGTDAGRLVLTNRKTSSDAALYTNFLILDRFRTADGKPLIDYAVPENSVLLQLALPRDQTAVRHPVVFKADATGDQWRPIFRKTDDKRYQQAIAWIKGMYRPRPEYPIDYIPARPFVVTKPGPAAGDR